MDIFIVYCTTCIINKKIYIGVHKQSDEIDFDGYIGNGVKINSPCTYEHSKTIFQRAVKKYGPKNFIRKTIKVYDNEEDAFALEAEIVNEEFLARKDVYNMVLGGNGGDRGVQAKPCYQYNKQGNFIREFKNRQEASRFMNKGFTTIKRAISDKIMAAGYYWSGEKVDKLDLSQYKTSTNRIPVYQYSNTGEYDCCYESLSDAARVNNSCTTNISRACKLGYMVHDKYFSYEFNTQFSIAKFEYIHQIPIYMYDITGKYICEFENLEKARKKLKAKVDLYKYVRLGTLYKKQYQFSTEKLSNMSDKSTKKYCKRRIAQYDLEGNLIREFNSVGECVKIYGGGVKQCLRGRNKTSKGFIYKYID